MLSLTLPILIEPNALMPILNNAGQLADILIVDLSKQSVHNQAHIPHAVWLDVKRLQTGDTETGTGVLPSLEVLQQILRDIGYSEHQHIIAYDDEGGAWAGRFIWTLELLGIKRYSVVNGGVHAWLAEGLPTESGRKSTMPSDIVLSQLHLSARKNIDEILALIQGAARVVLWDCRSIEEYTGERLMARRGGHIPSAIHYEWSNLIDYERQMRLRSLDDIKQALISCQIICNQSQGEHAFLPIVTYCQTHHRSGLTFLVGRILGLDISAYDGAWSQWGNRLDTPVVMGLLAD